MRLTNFTIDELEEALAAIIQRRDHVLELPLALPAFIPFCAEPMVWQIIATMGRMFPDSFEVRFKGLRSSAMNIEKVLSHAFGYGHVVFAFAFAKCKDEEGVDLGDGAGYFDPYLAAMNRNDFAHTYTGVEARANIIFLQTELETGDEFIRSFYEDASGRDPRVRDASDLRPTLQAVLGDLNPSWSAATLKRIGEPFSSLVKELVENSQYWARKDELGRPYRDGVRILSFRTTHLDKENAADFAAGSTNLFTYLNQTLLNRKGQEAEFIEVSLVDSGPGLARRWMSGEMSIPKKISLSEVSEGDEKGAVRECFGRWRSSAHISERGIGLFSAAEVIRERKGFMRVRTGRTGYLFGTDSAIGEVERTLKKLKKGLKDIMTFENGTVAFLNDAGTLAFFLKPWADSLLAETYGTSFSMLLPVD